MAKGLTDDLDDMTDTQGRSSATLRQYSGPVGEDLFWRCIHPIGHCAPIIQRILFPPIDRLILWKLATGW
jgi:hypothetical protein